MFENVCSDIVQIMKWFALERFNLSCQAEHTKINNRLNFKPRLALIAFWTTRPWILIRILISAPVLYPLHRNKSTLDEEQNQHLTHFGTWRTWPTIFHN